MGKWPSHKGTIQLKKCLLNRGKSSSLLWDSVRVLARLMERGRGQANTKFTNHTRRAKRRALGILNAKSNKQREPLYRDLLEVTRRTVTMAERMAFALAGRDDGLRADLLHYMRLAELVISQTERRVLLVQTVPAAEKVVSIFEEHTDVIVKDRRDTYYGHKVCLTFGKSGLFLDCVIEDGNLTDSELAQEMIARQTRFYGRPPRQAAFDGGFASKDNLRDRVVVATKTWPTKSYSYKRFLLSIRRLNGFPLTTPNPEDK